MKLSSFLLFALLFFSAYGQRFQQFKPTLITLRSKAGFLIAHTAKMSHLPKHNTYGFEMEFTRQDTTHNGWNDVYKNPLKGLSVQYQNVGNNEVLGQSFSLFAHTTFPLVQGPRFGFLDFRGGAGFGLLTRCYNVDSNPKNCAIGSYLNGFVSLGFQYTKYFEHWHIGGGIDFCHYSNSATKVPNLGLNIPSLTFNIGYGLRDRYVYTWSKTKAIECSEQNHDYNVRMADHFRLFLIGSWKQNEAKSLPVKTRPVVAVMALYSLKVGKRWKVDFALDGVYNTANQYRLDTVAYSFGQTLQFGAFVGASIHFNRAEFATGLGVYFYSPIHPFGIIYNRLGFRFHFTEKLSGIVGIKAHLAVADYLEIGLGYKLWQGKCK